MDKQELQDLGWCIVEMMGHRKLGGQCREVNLAGAVMLRVDIPGEPPMTQFYGAPAVFSITPTSEAVARAVAARYVTPPIQRWELAATSASTAAALDDEAATVFDEDDDPEF